MLKEVKRFFVRGQSQPETSTPQVKNILFSGESGIFGGLSNDVELAKICPEEFVELNPWSTFGMEIFYHGAGMSNWKWITKDKEERKHQEECLAGLLSSSRIGHYDKDGIVGWMLSTMLKEAPEVVSKEKDSKTMGPFYFAL